MNRWTDGWIRDIYSPWKRQPDTTIVRTHFFCSFCTAIILMLERKEVIPNAWLHKPSEGETIAIADNPLASNSSTHRTVRYSLADIVSHRFPWILKQWATTEKIIPGAWRISTKGEIWLPRDQRPRKLLVSYATPIECRVCLMTKSQF